MTPEFFAALPSPSTQQEVLQCLIDLLLETQRSKVVAMVKDIIFKVRNLFQSLTQYSVVQVGPVGTGSGGDSTYQNFCRL